MTFVKLTPEDQLAIVAYLKTIIDLGEDPEALDGLPEFMVIETKKRIDQCKKTLSKLQMETQTCAGEN